MMHRTFQWMALGGIGLIGLVGCGDSSFFERGTEDASDTEASPSNEEASTRLVPEFRLDGTGALPEQLAVERMDFHVSEILFEPADTADEVGGIGFVARPDPVELDFRVGRGDTSEQTDPIALPSPGRYEVVLRLEPLEERPGADKSVAFSGYFPVDSASCRQPRRAQSGENSDGEPIPIPYDPEKAVEVKSASPAHWGDFSYASNDSYRYSLGEIELKRGIQMLTFTLDVGAWGQEMRKPIQRALERHECPDFERTEQRDSTASTDEADTLSVDVSDEVDQFGEGPEQMEDHLSVQTHRAPDEVTSNVLDGG